MSELILLLVIALLVIRPADLPDVVYTLGCGLKSLQKWLAKVKLEFDKLMEPAQKGNEHKRDEYRP